MRQKLTMGLVVLCLAGSGCAPLAHVARTTIIEPVEYCFGLNDHVDRSRNCREAEAAWAQFQLEQPNHEFSHDFNLGFVEGFADYLYAGGSGQPPPVPPRPYWRPEYESLEGHQAIQDWNAGFREGAWRAKSSGLRQRVLLPTPMSPVPTQPLVPLAGTFGGGIPVGPLPESRVPEIGPTPGSLPPLKLPATTKTSSSLLPPPNAVRISGIQPEPVPRQQPAPNPEAPLPEEIPISRLLPPVTHPAPLARLGNISNQ